MKNDKVEMLNLLEAYIDAGISPILLEDVESKIFHHAVLLEANCDVSLLNGHYEETSFIPPEWYTQIIEKSKNRYALFVIEGINQISEEEQLKFLELLKYKKISTFELPKNCVIIATCSHLEEKPIAKEIYSLMVHVERR